MPETTGTPTTDEAIRACELLLSYYANPARLTRNSRERIRTACSRLAIASALSEPFGGPDVLRGHIRRSILPALRLSAKVRRDEFQAGEGFDRLKSTLQRFVAGSQS
jgi:hypothetical protein